VITAVDTNVLLDVFSADERFGPTSSGALRTSLDAGRLIVCDIVWAETTASFPSEQAAEAALLTLGADYVVTTQPCAALAGSAWQAYRRAGGPRGRVIADFMIGAHALGHADRLLTRDLRFFRAYFPKLTVVEPDDAS
jgi:predicted nucleic acid-binding protein